LGIGDWGLGPIPNPHKFISYIIILFNKFFEKKKNKIHKLNLNKGMISIKKFLEYLVNTIQNINKSERIKEEMNSHERCEPYAIFSRLDREDKGFLVKDDFFRFLKENGVNLDPQRKTIDLFIEYYDKNFDEKLDFTEFLNFILNKNQNLSRSITSQRETYKISCDEYLDKNLENLIVQSLMSDFYLFEYSDTKKIEIFLNLDENGKNCDEDRKLINLFIDLDEDKDGLISCEDLYEFASKRKIKICNEELQDFIGLFDEDMDGFLDWNEFLFMMLPSSQNFEYNLESLKRQEEMYNQFYYQSKNFNGNFKSCPLNDNNYNNSINYNCNEKKFYYTDYNKENEINMANQCNKNNNNNYYNSCSNNINGLYESKNYNEITTNFDYSNHY